MASMRTIGVRLRLLVDGFRRDADEAARKTEQVGKSAKKAKVDLDDLARGATMVGTALVGFAGAAIFHAGQFEKSMSAAAAATNANAEELEALRVAALEAGRDTAFSADEAAQGIVELGKAGIGTADILSGALRGALDLAAAGQIGVGEAAETAASAMTQFGLTGEDVVHIADLLAAGAGKAQGGVGDMSQALAQAGLVASQTGLSIEETTGTLAAFASAGLIGSDAGTSFRTMLLRLAAPAGKAADLMDELGISAFGATGEFVGMEELARRLQVALGGMSQEQRQATLATIFGSDAIRAASILYEQGAEGIAEWVAAVDEQGFAAKTASQLTDNLRGDLERLGGTIESTFIEAGTGANEGLRILTQRAEGFVETIGGLPPPVQQAGVVIAGLAGSTLLAAAGWIKFKQTIDPALESLRNAGTVGRGAARGLQLTTQWAGKVTAALGAMAAGSLLVSQFIGGELNPQIDAAVAGLKDWDRQSELSGEAARLFGADAEDLGTQLQILAQGGFFDVVNEVDNFIAGLIGSSGPIDNAKEKVAALDATLSQMVKEGRTEQAARLIEVFAEKAGLSVQQVRDLLPGYTGAVEVAAKGTEELANETQHLAREQLAAVDAGQTLVELWDELHGATKTADEEMLDAIEAIDGITEAFENSSGALKGNSEAALKNRIAIENAAREAHEAADAYLAQGGSATGAAQILDDFREKAIAAAVAAGGNADEVKRLADEMFGLPGKKDIVVIARTEGAQAAIKAVQDALDKVKGKDIIIRAAIRFTSTGLHVPGGTILRREGGITTPAQEGLLREAEIFPPKAPARFAFAEPATGGEAFVPKRSTNRQRVLGILQEAGRWHGVDMVPRGSGGRGGVTVENLNVQAWSDRFELRQIERELAMHGAI